jgi:uncharacterized protein YciI
MLAAWALACALAAQAAPPSAAPASPAGGAVFALVFRTGPAWDKSKAPGQQPFFAEHSKNLRDLRAEGRLVMGARFSDLGLVLVRAASVEDARALVDRDPSVTNRTFEVEVHPFHAFMPGCVGPESPPAK